MLDSGATTKYLLYAIGEILLVMIGILLALQVNNWNEQRKLEVSSKFYLQRLLDDVNADIESLKDYADRSKRSKNDILSMINSLEKKAIDDRVAFERALNTYYRFPSFSTNLTTYRELISSGKLELIKNTELRKALDDYAQSVEGNALVRERYAADVIDKTYYVDKYVKTVISEEGGSLSSKYDFYSMAEDQHLINLFSRFSMRWENNEIGFVVLHESASNLKSMLEVESTDQ